MLSSQCRFLFVGHDLFLLGPHALNRSLEPRHGLRGVSNWGKELIKKSYSIGD